MENEKLTYINSRGERLELGVDSVYHCNISKDVEGNNYPWNVNTNIGARGACDLVRTLQAQSSTEYWQGLRKG